MATLKTIFASLVTLLSLNVSAQCADPANIYSFTYNGHSYDVIKENKTWTDAVTCAVSMEGYLAEINDTLEQVAIFNELISNAEIDIANTENQFGTASVWLGGSDAVTEGEWIWDGNNDGIGAQFWSGGPDGISIDDSFTHWGISPPEPDNSGGQDHLTIIIKPTAINYGLWNDLVSTNTIYYLVEYDFVLSAEDYEREINFVIYPNPIEDKLFIEHNSDESIHEIKIYDMLGELKLIVPVNESITNSIDVSSLDQGTYILSLQFDNGRIINRTIVK